MAAPPKTRAPRVRLQAFNGGVFGLTAAALVLAPLLAGANAFHSYTPFLLLRLWIVGFCWYGASLARRAAGLRRSWQGIYVIIALPFLFLWGLKVEEWAIIDFIAAALVGVSAAFLRTEPGRGDAT